MLNKRLLNTPFKRNIKKESVKQFSRFRYSESYKLRLFATSSKFEDDADYEIDLISLKKTPKKPKTDFKIDFRQLEVLKKSLFHSEPKNRSVSPDPLDDKKTQDNDCNGYLEFVQRYYSEMQVFLNFIVSSYNGKIRSFDQLTSTEMSNSLYVFRDYYTKNKIPQITKYNYISYNYMFTRLLKYLSSSPDFPKVLATDLLPNIKIRRSIIALYNSQIGNFADELISLSNEYNFQKHTLNDLSKEINKTLDQFSEFVTNTSTFDKEFFRVLIQISRYKLLKTILDHEPNLEARFLSLIISDPELTEVTHKSSSINGDLTLLENTIKKFKNEIDFIKTAYYDIYWDDFAEFSTFLYEQANNPINDNDVKRVLNRLLYGLSPLYGKGILKINDLIFLDTESPVIPIRAFKIPKDNYDISLIYNLGIHEMLDSLGYLRAYLETDFGNLSKREILNSLDKMIGSFKGNLIILDNLKILNDCLSKYFSLVSWNGSFLDKLVNDLGIQSCLEEIVGNESFIEINSGFKSSKKASYVVYNNLSKFSNELKELQENELNGFQYSLTSPRIMQAVLNSIIKLARETSFKEPGYIKATNLKRYEGLTEELSTYFRKGGPSSYLDTIVASPSKTYTQIPDDLELHKFSKELEIFKVDELKDDYKNFSAPEILSFLDRRIHEVHSKPSFTNDLSRLKQDNIHNFIRLNKRLHRLFDINGGNTSILDTLIHSQSVFEQFEAKKARSSKVAYKQVPDSFFLEEFLLELTILKGALGTNFERLSSSLILKKIEDLMESEISIEKKVIWRKLLFNLSNLFKINNDYTFILDNVLISGEKFLAFEYDKAFKKLVNKSKAPPVVGEQSKLINEYFENIKQILTNSKLVDKLGIWKLSEAEFGAILQNQLSSLDKTSPGFAINSYLINSMMNYNSKIEYYPNFLQQLFEIKQNNLNKVLTSVDTEDIYKAIIENIEYENSESNIKLNESIDGFKQRLSVPVENDRSNNFRMNEFKISQPQESSTAYNDSEKFLSYLVKSEKPVDLESNEVLKRPSFREKTIDSDTEIKDAVSIALNSKLKRAKFAEKREPGSSDFRSNITKASSRKKFKEPEGSVTTKIDKASIEDFLKNARKEKELAKERKFRESKAYEWSRSMYKSHRSLESRNFFNPLYDSSILSSRSDGLLFPSVRSRGKNEEKKSEYLILMLDGKTIKSENNPLGKRFPEDIFQILNKFNGKETSKFVKKLKKLQRKKWKLIGSKIESNDQKYLILSRDRNSNNFMGRVFSKIKTVLTVIGTLVIILVSLDFWLEQPVDGSESDKYIPETSLQASVRLNSDNEILPSEAAITSEDSVPKSFLFKKLLWNTKNVD